MSGAIFSSSWYRVAQLKPRLRSQARLHRHHYRGERWYVLQNQSTRDCQRLSKSAHFVIGLMDGRRTMEEVWDITSTRLGDDSPTQDEIIRLLGTLQSSNALHCDVAPDIVDMLQRSNRRRSSEDFKRALSPLSIRIKLFDPDRFLTKAMPFMRPFFSPGGALLWLAVVATAMVLAGSHWPEIMRDPMSSLLSGQNLLLLGVVYPCVKAIHEFGHGITAKAFGAEVHETGIMFVVFMPLPYVDASGASVFPEKGKRMLVGAAGILVEVFLASLALLVWLAVEPGILRSMAYNVMWIGGVSTLLFNANPLVRFDGYYVLSDAIEIPNLGARSNSYLAYLLQRHFFGMHHVRNPIVANDEAPWLFGYGVASYVYRVTLALGIALFVATKFFIVGVLLATLSLGTQLVMPAARSLGLLLFSPRFGEKRVRSVGFILASMSSLAAVFIFLPIPLYTMAEGVVWLPEDAQIRVQEDGFVERVLVPALARVRPGDPILLMSEPLLEARVEVLSAKLRALKARQYAERSKDLALAQITQEEIQTAEANLARARAQKRSSVVRASSAGIVVLPRIDDLQGRFLHKGEMIGYVTNDPNKSVRVAIGEREIALVRDRTKATEVRLASRIEEVWPARIERHVPAASHRLPTAVLGTMGGGKWLVDPSDTEGLETLNPVFQLDLSLLGAAPIVAIGERVYVRFDHGAEPLAVRAYRGLRRLLLNRFDV